MTETNRQLYVEALKGAFIARAKQRALTKITAKLVGMNLGFLAGGPFGFILSLIIDKVITEAIDDAETLVFFKFVDIRVAQQGSSFEASALAFFKIQTTGTKEEVDAAEKKMLSDFDSFIHFNSL